MRFWSGDIIDTRWRLTHMTQSRTAAAVVAAAAACFKRSVFSHADLIGSDGLLEGGEIKHGS